MGYANQLCSNLTPQNWGSTYEFMNSQQVDFRQGVVDTEDLRPVVSCVSSSHSMEPSPQRTNQQPGALTRAPACPAPSSREWCTP